MAAAEASGAATRTWVLKTDEDGEIYLGNDWKVSGDDFWLTSFGSPAIPIGTIIIQETKAPAGYVLNPEKFLRKITAVPGSSETVNTYNAPTVGETGMELHLVKRTDPDQADKSGFQFEITGPGGYAKTVTTPANGELDMAIPAAGTYTVTELPRDGWIIGGTNPQTVTFAGTPGETRTVTFSNLKTAALDLVKTTDWPSDDPSGFTFRIDGPNGYTTTETTDAGGRIHLTDLEPGSYTATELTTGKAANYQPAAPQTIEIMPGETGHFSFANKVKRVEIELEKTSEDGKVEGIQFRFDGPDGYSETRATDANGKIKLTDLMPGTYTATELPTADGRYRENVPQTVTVNPGEAGTYSFENELIRGGVRVRKYDAETWTEPQGDATLSGAEFEIVSLNDNPVVVDGATYNKGDVVYAMVTAGNENMAESPADLLPYGRYELNETRAPKGYTAKGHISQEFSITEDGQIYDLTLDNADRDRDTVISNEVIQGRIRIVKHSDTGETGIATPEVGAQFQIYLTSAGSYDAAKETERDLLTIDEDGFAESKLLPYGTYVIEQISGFESSDFVEPFTVKIAEDGKTYNFIVNNMTFTAYAKVIKVDARTGETIPVAGVGFNVYKPDGEKITFFGIETWYTGEDGIVRIPARLEYGYEYYLMEVPGTEPDGYVLSTEPIYFDVTPENSVEEYNITTIPVEFENEPTKVAISKQDMGGVELPGAHMRVIEKETGELVEEWISTDEPHMIYNLVAERSYTLIEDLAPLGYVRAVSVDFVVLDTAEVQQVVMVDKILSVAKVDYTGAFVPGAELAVYEGEDLIEQWISADELHAVSGLEADHTYILRELTAPEGWLLADPIEFTVTDDMMDQIISMENEESPEIHTTATVDGSHLAQASGTVTLVDRVFYDKLIPGREYTLTGTLMVKETGKELLDKDGNPYTATVTFTPDEPTGYVDVIFEIDASELAGETVVAFEDLTKNEKTLVIHANIEDEEQSVHFPEIKTTATVNGKHKADVAESVTLIDVVSYNNLIPGREYTVKGVLMVKETGKALLDKDGKPVTAEATFTAEEAKGKVELTFTFDASDLAGKSVVAFEEVYDGELLVGTHTDIEDKGQTVYFPDTPNTGDTANVGLWAAMASLSGAALAAGAWLGIKRRKNKVAE